MQQAKFTYSSLGTAFEKRTTTSKEQGRKHRCYYKSTQKN